MFLFNGKVKVDKEDTFIPNRFPIIVSPLQTGEWNVKIEVNRAIAEWDETVTIPKETLEWKELGDVNATQMSFGLVLLPGDYKVRSASHPETKKVVRLVWDKKR